MMETQIGRDKSKISEWVGDLWGGLAAMLVALPSAIAFGVLVYTGIGPEYVGAGAMTGILGAAALGLVAPFIGRTGGLISAPCAPAAAVLSALVAELVAKKAGIDLTPANILSLLAMVALLSAGFQIFFGIIGGGRLIKFIPYPVVTGYLSAVGVIIVIGQLPKLFGYPDGTSLAQGLISPALWRWEGLVVGIVTIVLMVMAPRVTKKVPAAIIGLSGGIFTYFALGLFSPTLMTLQGNSLVIGPIQASGSFFDAIVNRTTSLFTIELGAIKYVIIPAITLSVLLSIDTLKTCIGLDALTRSRHNSNREILGQGVGNMVSCLVGGMPGAGTMGPTLVNVTSGGKTFRSGAIEAIFVIFALLLLSNLIAWVPIGALAGILIFIGWRMFDKSMFHLLRYPAGRLDFVVIAGVITVSLTIDLIAATGVGVAFAILLFIRDQIRSSVIRRKHYLNQTSSKTRRPASQNEMLKQNGDQGVFCELQGNIFFGTTDQLFTQMEEDIRTKRYILFDMRRVQSLDYTAAHLFDLMHTQLAERDGQLLFSGMPSTLIKERNFEQYLAQLGLIGQQGGVMITETLDSALEWMEEKILEDAGLSKEREEQRLDLKDFDLFQGLDEATLNKLNTCVSEISFSEKEKVFSQGDEGDEMFLIRRGSVRIMLPLLGGKRHHIATISRGSLFGELSFIDRDVRSADAEAKAPTDLYVLSRTRLNEQFKSDMEFGLNIFTRLAREIGVRLRQTDAELRVLEER